jgi:integrase
MEQQKSGWVRVPIPMSVYDALMVLPIKGRIDGKEYWFRTDVGTLATNIKTWRGRITRLFHKAQEPILDANGKWTKKYSKPFAHHATPHTWRHTFAILHLNAGTRIKFVSRWLGHESEKITESHYGHANSDTNIADEDAYDESLEKQDI